jgi:hypothetical protein
MREIDVQTYVVNAVKEGGGAAKKLANRFLVGVVDLLIKLPGQPAMLMEVKLEQRAQMTRRTQHPLVPAVTVPQFHMLAEYHHAGMLCGVMSFVEEARKGKRGLWLRISMLPEYRTGLGFHEEQYYFVGGNFTGDVLDQLITAARSAKEIL